MKINCICCGHSIDLGEDYSDYDGLIKCWVCSSLLSLRSEQGCAKSVLPASLSLPRENFTATAELRGQRKEFAYGQETH